MSMIKPALQGVMDEIRKNSAAANVVFRASTELREGMHCEGRVGKFDPLDVDEPLILGGTNKGPNPVELLLVALGTCQEIVYRAYATLLEIPIDSVKCTLKGHLDLRGFFGLDEDCPAGYQKIAYQTEITSPASFDELRKLSELVERRCPVLNSLERPVPIDGTVVINGETVTPALGAVG